MPVYGERFVYVPIKLSEEQKRVARVRAEAAARERDLARKFAAKVKLQKEVKKEEMKVEEEKVMIKKKEEEKVEMKKEKRENTTPMRINKNVGNKKVGKTLQCARVYKEVDEEVRVVHVHNSARCYMALEYRKNVVTVQRSANRYMALQYSHRISRLFLGRSLHTEPLRIPASRLNPHTRTNSLWSSSMAVRAWVSAGISEAVRGSSTTHFPPYTRTPNTSRMESLWYPSVAVRMASVRRKCSGDSRPELGTSYWNPGRSF